MENLWNHFVPTTSAICGVKTKHSGLNPYRSPWRICHIIWSLWVGNLLADKGVPYGRMPQLVWLIGLVKHTIRANVMWLQYVDDTFVVCPYGPEQLQNLLDHHSSIKPIQFTMQVESNSEIPFLYVPVIRKGMTLATKFYRKPIHTGWYLSFTSNHPPLLKRGLILCLHNRSSTVCQEQQNLSSEISNLRYDQLSGYSEGFIDFVINSKGSSRLNKEEKSLGPVYIPYVKGVLEKFKHVGNWYNIKTIIKTEHTS
jgi:hypothetical protein